MEKKNITLLGMRDRGFTLIELLVVLGILAVLIITVLVTLNPAEAQKKARDNKRMKDLTTLTTILDQLANSNTSLTGNCLISANGCNSAAVTTTQTSQPCSSSWLAIDVCKYANSVPVDPRNGQSTIFIKSDGSADTAITAQYKAKVSSADYEVDARLESAQNASKLSNDGGDDSNWLEAGTSLTLDPVTP